MSPKPICPHTDATKLFAVCAHLRENQSNVSSEAREYYRCFSGRGLDRELVCKVCAEKGTEADIPKVYFCEECFQEVEENGRRLGDRGVPEYPVRNVGLELVSRSLSPLPDGARVVKIAAVQLATGSHWLALTDRHELLRLEFVAGNIRRVCGVAELGLPTDQELSLIASSTGDFAVVATTGETGVVVEIASGAVTMKLSRGNYHNEHCRYSAAFFEHDGRTLLVHATDWNRLDVSDPRTGQLLTSRAPTAYKSGEERPAHYLDYFHCGLVVSPDNEWVADNGWVWHPVGVVQMWNLRTWLTANVWESEDGKTKRSDIWREYFWDGPLCWVSNHQIAVWGVGRDDYSLLPAIRVIDVIDGKESTAIVGPFGPSEPTATSGAALRDGKLTDKGVFEFDRYLFAWSPAAGFSVWDIADGARLFEAREFCPLAYNRATQQFFSQDSAGNCRLTKLTP